MNRDILESFLNFLAAASVVAAVLKTFLDYRQSRRAQERVLEAEREAFRTAPEAVAAKTEKLLEARGALEQQARELNSAVPTATRATLFLRRRGAAGSENL
jgi:hypothetical protein